MKQILKDIGIGLLNIFLHLVNALGSVVKNNPKFFGIVSATSAFFIACIVSPAFLEFAAQIIALLAMGGLGYLIFFKKSDKPKPPQRNNRNRRR